MKAVENNTAVSASNTSAPFFKKEGKQSFFGTDAPTSFFPTPQSGAPAVQTKLSVGKPGDVYEREADLMAEKVVQQISEPVHTGKKSSKPTASANTPAVQSCEGCDGKEEKEKVQRKAIFESNEEKVVQRKANRFQGTNATGMLNRSAIPFQSTATSGAAIQMKCAACEAEEKKEEETGTIQQKIQRKPIFESISKPSPGSVQRKCAACEAEEKKVHRKAIFESNEQQPEEGAVQRKCAACEEEEKKVQRKPKGNNTQTSPSIESTLSAEKGGGNALPEGVRGDMESAFGTDFSTVRVHTDSTAVQMSTNLQAQAFTHGNDIYFNTGKYDTNSRDGKQLLAHELTHVVQQNYAPQKPAVQRGLWDDFVDTVDAAADATGDAISDAGSAVADTASAAGSAIYSAGETAYEYGAAGAQAVGEAAVAAGETVYEYGAAGVEAIGEAGSAAINWLATEAGALAQRFVEFFGGTIRITSAGIEVTLPEVCPLGATPFSHTLDPIEGKYMVPVFAVPLGATGLFITGEVGLTGSITPQIQLQLGPFCLKGAHILINPITSNYSVSGSISFTGAAALAAELRGGVRGELGVKGVIVVGGVPIPIDIPAVAMEGGLAGLVRGIGAGTYELGGSLMYSGGTISATHAQKLDFGLAADLYAGAYGQLDALGKKVCRMYWQPYEWHGSMAGSVGISADLAITTGGLPSLNLNIDPPTFTSIPFDQIPLAINRDGFSDDCPIVDKLCEILKDLGLLPSLNGGSWDWGGTGHGGTYGPGTRLAGPLDAYQRNPGIASGSLCRGACGINCNTCEHQDTYIYTDPVSGETWQYTNYEECNSHDGCRQHDAAFDWAAAEHGETGGGFLDVFKPWHMAGNIECACNNLGGNCLAWIIGLPPYDMKMYFADSAVKISSGAPLPPGGGGGGVTHSSQPIGEWGPDFYHYSANVPGDIPAGGERWTDYRTNCAAEARAATGVPDNLNYISVLRDQDADTYLNRNQFTPRQFFSLIHGIRTEAYHYRSHTLIPRSAYTTTTLDIFTDDCSGSAVAPTTVPPGGPEEERQLEQCDLGQLPPDECEALHDRVIRRFGNRERDLNIDPDQASEDRIREDDAPISSSFRRLYNRLDSWELYIRNRHPDWYPEFNSTFKVGETKILWQKELKERVREFKLRFRDVRNQDTEALNQRFRREVLSEMENRINAKNREIAAWYKAKTGSQESIEAIIERVHAEGTEMWRSAWRNSILAINRILSRLWPVAKARINGWVADQRRLHPGKDLSGTVGDVDYVGSLATGVKGAPKQFVRFNPDKFDVDANIVAPPLEKFAVFIRGISPDRGRIFAVGQNTTITPLINFCEQAHREMSAVEGYNEDDPFDVVIEASETPSQERSSGGTERIYALRCPLGEVRYQQMITELRTAGLLVEITEVVNGQTITSWQVKPELTHAEGVQLNAILRRYEGS